MTWGVRNDFATEVTENTEYCNCVTADNAWTRMDALGLFGVDGG